MCKYLTWESVVFFMLIEKIKNIEITRWNINYYNKIQECKIGDYIDVDVYLLGDSYYNERVKIQCDYCGKITTLSVGTVKKNKEHKYNNKHSCKECLGDKRRETNLLKYNVDNPMKVQKFKDNLQETIQEIYGVDNVFQNEKIKQKSKQTIKEKYGVEHIMYLDEIKDKVITKSRKTLSENGTVNTSKQQLYLNQLYGGILNYPEDKILLDIAFPNNKIYIEYNGGGHDLSVKIGRETQEEFNTKERKRFHFLKSKGWKGFIINSPRDYLPLDKYLLKEFSIAKASFEEGKTKYTIILEDKIESEKYGTMRAIQ